MSAPIKLPPLPNKVIEAFNEIKTYEPVIDGLKKAKEEQEHTLKEQVELTEIESAPFHEENRAKAYAAKLTELGLPNVRIDKEGNVVGVRAGTGNGPRLALCAHLDTVFPMGTDVKVRREGNMFYAPGISDDARGLAVVLEVLRLLNQEKIETVGDIVFLASVGEEGNGDLRGTKYFFKSNEEPVDGFISIDGAPVDRILHGSTGSRRFRVTYEGPGGHSWSAFGNPSANHALGRAIAMIADVKVPEEPRTSFTVGVVEGGTTVNAIAAKATMEIDTRSVSNDELNKLVDQILPLLQKAADDENARWNAPADKQVKVIIEPIGHRPAGDQPDTSPVLLAARAAMDVLMLPLKRYSAASTDQNVALSLGIPATTLGGGGTEGNNHNLTEWFNAEDSYQGPQLALLTVLGLVGIKGRSEPLLPKRS
ncbi:MAG: M20/M25/M40 family metallo-hydrolase [Burkholderiales bacterium]|nr:M20/M25/M40 family metallo-hydrolase [Burkholderiales bacterium]